MVSILEIMNIRKEGNMQNKKIIIVFLTCVMLLISACGNNNIKEDTNITATTEKNIIGTWTAVQEDRTYLGDTITFKEDGTGTTDEDKIEWKIEDDMLKILYDGEVYRFYVTFDNDKIEFSPIEEVKKDDLTFELTREEKAENDNESLVGKWKLDDITVVLNQDGTGTWHTSPIEQWTIEDGILTVKTINEGKKNSDDSTFEVYSTTTYEYTLDNDILILNYILSRRAFSNEKYVYEKF